MIYANVQLPKPTQINALGKIWPILSLALVDNFDPTGMIVDTDSTRYLSNTSAWQKRRNLYVSKYIFLTWKKNLTLEFFQYRKKKKKFDKLLENKTKVTVFYLILFNNLASCMRIKVPMVYFRLRCQYGFYHGSEVNSPFRTIMC